CLLVAMLWMVIFILSLQQKTAEKKHLISQYIDHVKYLCEGHIWSSCSYAVKTNKPDPSGKYSISDDKKGQIFTVTIKNLTNQNTDYWCVVEINNGPDCGQYFQLSVTSGKCTSLLTFQILYNVAAETQERGGSFMEGQAPARYVPLADQESG
uniref:Immunoglobulin V-set domain-containing protein n=1 Tax=Haplochromis burtoni TaxID=8153 RepID=A0A3Q2X3S9_HAPBU